MKDPVEVINAHLAEARRAKLILKTGMGTSREIEGAAFQYNRVNAHIEILEKVLKAIDG